MGGGARGCPQHPLLICCSSSTFKFELKACSPPLVPSSQLRVTICGGDQCLQRVLKVWRGGGPNLEKGTVVSDQKQKLREAGREGERRMGTREPLRLSMAKCSPHPQLAPPTPLLCLGLPSHPSSSFPAQQGHCPGSRGAMFRACWAPRGFWEFLHSALPMGTGGQSSGSLLHPGGLEGFTYSSKREGLFLTPLI